MKEEIGVWHAMVGSQPTRLAQESVPFEKYLETWIFEDMSLVSPSLHRIGRQVNIDGKFMDILAIEEPGVWVICEIKKTPLYRDSIAQAIDYVARFDLLNLQDLRELLSRHNGQQSENAKSLIERALDREKDGEPRDIRVVLAGVGVKEDLNQIVNFLSEKYSFPISISAYSALAAPGDDQGFLLLRDVSEDSESKLGIGDRSQDYESRMSEVRSHFMKDKRIEIFEALTSAFSDSKNLYIRPWKKAIMVAPGSHHGRYLAYYTSNSKGIRAMVSKESVLEFFPDAKVDVIPEDQVDVYLNSVTEAQTWAQNLLEALKNASISTSGTYREWNGKDWYVAFGDDECRKWSDARQHGFVSAGGGDWYSRTFKTVPVGSRVFAYIPSVGYVGAGITTEPAVPFKQSKLSYLSNLEGTYTHTNGELEYILPVKWINTFEASEGFYQRGMFASQHSACKLREEKTLKLLYEKFQINELNEV